MEELFRETHLKKWPKLGKNKKALSFQCFSLRSLPAGETNKKILLVNITPQPN